MPRKGYKQTEEHKTNISIGMMGHDTSKATREKMRVAMIGKNANEKSGLWKGDEVGYFALHVWIRFHKPKPLLCEMCHKRVPFDVANISGEYRRDVKDFLWVCRSCNNNMKIPMHSRFKK